MNTLIILISICFSVPDDLQSLYYAIFMHESQGGSILVGDDGKSLGPYHIQKAYWIDGGGDPFRYERDVYDHAKCQAVMYRYWQRYARMALDCRSFADLARCHNVGSSWKTRARKASWSYWLRVKSFLPRRTYVDMARYRNVAHCVYVVSCICRRRILPTKGEAHHIAVLCDSYH